MKQDPIAIVREEREALDGSPLYYIEVTQELKVGDRLRFDPETDKLYIDEFPK